MNKNKIDKYLNQLPFKVKKKEVIPISDTANDYEVTFEVDGNAIEVRKTLQKELQKAMGSDYMKVYPSVDGNGTVRILLDKKAEIVDSIDKRAVFKFDHYDIDILSAQIEKYEDLLWLTRKSKPPKEMKNEFDNILKNIDGIKDSLKKLNRIVRRASIHEEEKIIKKAKVTQIDIDKILKKLKDIDYDVDKLTFKKEPTSWVHEARILSQHIKDAKKSILKLNKIHNQASDESIVKKALYYYEKGNVHRITKKEAEDGLYFCPKCKQQLQNRKGKFNKLFVCINDGCNFVIREDQLTNGQRLEMPLRERYDYGEL